VALAPASRSFSFSLDGRRARRIPSAIYFLRFLAFFFAAFFAFRLLAIVSPPLGDLRRRMFVENTSCRSFTLSTRTRARVVKQFLDIFLVRGPAFLCARGGARGLRAANASTMARAEWRASLRARPVRRAVAAMDRAAHRAGAAGALGAGASVFCAAATRRVRLMGVDWPRRMDYSPRATDPTGQVAAGAERASPGARRVGAPGRDGP
jgi:hypothetical protein